MKTEIEAHLKKNHLSYNSAIRNDVGELLGIGDLIYKQNQSLNEQLEETRQTGLDSIKIAEDLSALKKKYEARVEELQAENAKLKASKSEANEAILFMEWVINNEYYYNGKHWRKDFCGKEKYTTMQVYEIFKSKK